MSRKRTGDREEYKVREEDLHLWKDLGGGLYTDHEGHEVDTSTFTSEGSLVDKATIEAYFGKPTARVKKKGKTKKKTTPPPPPPPPRRRARPPPPPPRVVGQFPKEYPYHPLLFHMDITSMAYFIYAQTLAFPWDPYAKKSIKKSDMMVEIHEWAREVGPANARKSPLVGYRGPGALGGFHNNDGHVPVVSRYGAVDPHVASLCLPKLNWLHQEIPKVISDPIKEVWIAYGKLKGTVTDRFDGSFSAGTHEVEIEKLPQLAGLKDDAKDTLLCFEGGTGGSYNTGTQGLQYTPHSQSLMGFVLMRMKNKGKFDIHISFRGSRSAGDKSNNPDWCTDVPHLKNGSISCLKEDFWGTHQQISSIAEQKVHNGFAYSMASIMPQLVKCFEKVAEKAGKKKPDRITVTGHSLGGALATHFVSSVLLGTFLDNSAYPVLPNACHGWPWIDIKLVTFSCPRAGNALWAEALNAALMSTYYMDSRGSLGDSNALNPSNGRLGDFGDLVTPGLPAAFRVLHSQDLITTSAGGKLGYSNHIGESVYVDHADVSSPFSSLTSPMKLRTKFAHEYMYVRDAIIAWNMPKYPSVGKASRLPTKKVATKFDIDQLVYVNLKADFTMGNPDYFLQLKNVFDAYVIKIKFFEQDYQMYMHFLGLSRKKKLMKKDLAAQVALKVASGFKEEEDLDID